MSARSAPRLTRVMAELPKTIPFVGPEAQERARHAPFRARIGANESVFGPSPSAIAAMQAAAVEVWKYCDPDNFDLKQAIAAHHGVAPDNVVIIEGIDGGLGLINRLLVEPGRTVITTDGAYPTFNFHVAACGGRLIKVPMRDDREDLAALLDAARLNDAHLLYVSNPNNPMGTWWSARDVDGLVRDLPAGTVLALDEAYVETAPAGTAPAIDVTNPQVVRFRTFSKAYGMAGARIGYCLGEAGLIAEFEKVRNHYGINRIAQAGALAALQDQAYLTATVEKAAASRARIADMVRKFGFQPIPSGTNFVTVDCGRDGNFAKAVLDGLLSRGIFVRMPGVSPLDRCIRIGVGTDADLDMCEEALDEVLSDLRG